MTVEPTEQTTGDSTTVQTATEPASRDSEPAKPARKTKSRVILNFWLDAALLVTVLFIGWISAILHIVFPLPTTADGWILWGLSFDQWRDIQSTALCFCGLLALEHVVLHWNWVCSTIATRIFRVKSRPDEAAQAIYGVGTFIVAMTLIMGSVMAAMLCIKPPPVTSTSQTTTSIPTTTKLGDRRQHLKDLLSLIRERLDLMPQVAQAKWNRKSPITDAKREASLLDDIQARGTARGLRADLVREFFQAQISASKLIQEHHIAEWTAREQPPFANPPDLDGEIRPKIDKLNEQLLEALGKHWAESPNANGQDDLDRVASAVFSTPQWPEAVVPTALEPLRHVPAH